MRAYLALRAEDLERIADGGSVSAPAFVAASEDEEDELAALEEAAGHGPVAAAVEVDDPDAPVGLADVAALHVAVDDTGDLAWYATEELHAVLAILRGTSEGR